MTSAYTVATANFETIIDFLRFGISEAEKAQLFYGHGTVNSHDEIFSLISGTLSMPRNFDKLLLNARVTSAEKKLLIHNLSRRILENVPVPYLIKEAFFCGLPFYVDEKVLIPRSPIAELITQHFHPWIEEENVHNVLDLCTGSACIAIACSYAFPDALIDAADISVLALEVAEINRKKHLLEEELRLIKSDCWDNIPPVRYDIIVSNPPYVGDEEMATLPAEYHHEPVLALRTGQNGLAIVEKILARAHDYLTDHGILIVEVGNSEEALMQAYPDLPFTWLDFEHGGQGVFLLTCEQLKAHRQ